MTESVSFDEASKKAKTALIASFATYFLRLGAFSGDLEEGVHCLWRVGIYNM